jgi:hypothetical protein
MAREILQSAVIHTDDTTVRVLDEAYTCERRLKSAAGGRANSAAPGL